MKVLILLVLTFIALKVSAFSTGMALFLSLISLVLWPFIIPFIILMWGAFMAGGILVVGMVIAFCAWIYEYTFGQLKSK